MVEDDVFLVALPGGIGSVVDVFLLSASDANEADDVVGTRAYREVAQGDARIGGRLSEDGDVVLDSDVGLQGNDTCHVEDDDAVFIADGSTKRACARVVEIGDVYDSTATSASSIASVTFSTRESGCLCQRGGGDGCKGK